MKVVLFLCCILLPLTTLASGIKKGKDGHWDVPWEILAEYDLGKKTLGKNLKKIVNKNVSVTGFIIPLDYSKKSITEFLLVPFIPACMHVPPPPPNMIISVKLDKKNAIQPGYYPFQVKGKITIDTTPKKPEPGALFVMDGIYTLKAVSAREVKRY